MSVLVTGGAGFIGSHIVDELMVQGHEVTIVDDLSEGTLENIKGWKGNPKLEFVRGNICDFDLMKRVCANKAWIFHLAASSRIQPSINDPFVAWRPNCVGTMNVLEAARINGVKRVVYSASSSAYGAENAKVVESGRGLTEDLKTDCNSPYSFSKLFGEELCAFYNKIYGLSTVSLRYFNVYGPRHQEEGNYATVIAIFKKQKRRGQKLTVVGDGTQRRDFTFVGDVVKANVLAAMNRDVGGTINIGTGKNHSILEIAAFVGGDVEFIPPRKGEYKLTLADSSKAFELLGWKASVDIIDGLKITEEYERRFPRGLIFV
jgi:UDP-glucose 4-epimerase